MRAKKSLGQNFLRSKAVVETIIETADLNNNDVVLEIGPGKGILTKRLLEEAGEVIAIEKDNVLFERLKKTFNKEIEEGRLGLINGDILKIENLGLERYKLVANIPYYITGEILREFLSNRTQPERIVLMLQKEVVERIVAKDGKESILSISVKAYGEPKYIEKVGKENFQPKPKVDSAILLIENISKKNFEEIDEKEFFNLVKKGFSQKRKLLTNNLKEFLPEAAFELCKIPLKSRAENLSLNNWKCLLKTTKSL
jgi:16S rRNA (adenine1518-N6/adenine1519-N6)-dimethyltransferase